MGLFDQLKNAVQDLTAAPGEAPPSTLSEPEPLAAGTDLANAAQALGFETDGRLWRSGYQYSTFTLGEIAARVTNYERSDQLSRSEWRSDAGLPPALCGPTLWGTFHQRPVTCFEFTRGDQFHAQMGVTLSSDRWTHATCAVVTLPCRFPSVALVPRKFGLHADCEIELGGLSQSFSVHTAREDFAKYFFNAAVVAAMSSVLDALVGDTNWCYEVVARYFIVTRAGRCDWSQLQAVLAHVAMLLDAIDPRLESRAWEPAVKPGPGLDAYPETYPEGHGPAIGLTRQALTGVAASVDLEGASPLAALRMVGAQIRDQVATAKLDADPHTAREPGWYETSPGRIVYFDGDFDVSESERAIGDLWNIKPSEVPEGYKWPGYHFVDDHQKRWWDGQAWGELEFTAGRGHIGRRPKGFVAPVPARRY